LDAEPAVGDAARPPSKFERDTAVRRVADGTYEGDISRDWWIVRGPNGGYVAAIVLRAMTATLGDDERQVRSLTVHYTRAPEEGPVRVDCTVERAGRSLTTLSARMTQDGALVALALAAFSTPWDAALEYDDVPAPEVPAPEQIDELPWVPPMPPMSRNFDMRFAIGGFPFTSSDESAIGGWIRLREPTASDGALVAQLADAFFPAPFVRASKPFAAPTIDLTVHFRAPLPAPGSRPDDFYLCRFESRLARDGFFEEDGLIWARDGTLLAQSRQLALAL
jgi:acyl-CoA thioesterase